MNSLKLSKLALAGFSLSSNMPSMASPSDLESSEPNQVANSVTEENALSVYLVEGAWLKIPGKCKDRSVSAEPIVLGIERISSEVESIHLSLNGNGLNA